MKFPVMTKEGFKAVLIWLTMLAREAKHSEEIRNKRRERKQKSVIGYRRVLSEYCHIKYYRRFRQYIERGGETVGQNKPSAYTNEAIGIYRKAKA